MATAETTAVAVFPATADRWDDLAVVMGHDGDRGCYCQYWRLASSDYSRSDHRAGLRRQLDADLPPGLLAYVDGEPCGWCSVGPRHEYERLNRSRTIPPIDDVPVWVIVCFLVRVGYRRRGVARALLDGAIDFARRHDAPALEAYPVDPEGRRIDVSFAYVGTTGMFEAAGFRRIAETAARSAGRPRIVMRLNL